MAKKDKNASDASGDSGDANKLEKIKSRLLTTGLEDYGFWWTQMLKEQEGKSAADPSSFRRGRIWS